jgi:hypothetical protein
MTERLLDLPPDRMDGEVVAALFFEDDRPLRGAASYLDWRLNGHLTKLLLQGRVTGATADALVCCNNGKLQSAWALMLGGGSRRRLNRASWQRLIKNLLEVCANAGFSRLALCLDDDGSLPVAELADLVDEARNDRRFQHLECLLTFVPVVSAADTLVAQQADAHP